MKKTNLALSTLATLGMALSLVACGGTEAKTIEVLVQTADHGWTGAVQSYAQQKVDALNAEGKYKVQLTACESATNEAQEIDNIIARKDSVLGVVMLPIDATVESSLNKLVDSGLPFTQFDRVINSDKIDNAANNVSSVKGDNHGIGYATGKRFLEKGLTKEDKILIMPGDNSSVPTSRNEGFYDALKEAGWTEDDIKSNTRMTDYTNWSRTASSTLFESLGNSVTEYDWVFTHDSEIALGVLESLNSNRTSQEVKDHFKTNVKSLCSSSGLDEMYAVIEGDHRTDYLSLLSDSCDLFDVTYDPAMIQIAIQDMVDHLDGKSVSKNHIVPVNVVDKTNVTQFQGFGSGNYRK